MVVSFSDASRAHAARVRRQAQPFHEAGAQLGHVWFLIRAGIVASVLPPPAEEREFCRWTLCFFSVKDRGEPDNVLKAPLTLNCRECQIGEAEGTTRQKPIEMKLRVLIRQ